MPKTFSGNIVVQSFPYRTVFRCRRETQSFSIIFNHKFDPPHCADSAYIFYAPGAVEICVVVGSTDVVDVSAVVDVGCAVVCSVVVVVSSVVVVITISYAVGGSKFYRRRNSSLLTDNVKKIYYITWSIKTSLTLALNYKTLKLK